MTSPLAIIFTAKGRDSLNEAQRQLIESCAEVEYVTTLQTLSDDEIIERCMKAHYIGLTRRTTKNFHAGLIAALPQLRGVSIYATGTEWIDEAALNRHHIAWRFLPDYSQESVAEHTLGMMLTLSRRLHLSDRIARGELPRSISLRGWEIRGKTIGIIGMGRIGQRIAELLQSFGVKLIAFDLVPEKIDSELAVVAASQANLLAAADIVILCASMNRDSPTIIGREQLALMQKHAVLLNPGRAELVSNQDLLAALKNKTIAGYAVDDSVFSQEQLAQIEHGRILQTGHTAWYADEAMARGTELWIKQLVELIQND